MAGEMEHGPVRKVLYDKLVAKFAPLEIELVCESAQHGLPASAEKHFRLVVVASAFENRSRVDRHRLVNDLLADELRGKVHALSIQAFTPEEWEKKQGATFASPACLGGSKKST